jgi:hypothetical protein
MKGPARLLLPILLLAGTPAGATIVMDQIGDPDSYNFGASANFTSQELRDFPDRDSMALDDFTVTSAELRITKVSALYEARAGITQLSNVPSYRVSIFTDPNDAASDLLGSDSMTWIIPNGPATDVVQVRDTLYGVLHLMTDITLPGAGTYWVGVAPNSSEGVNGQFFLQNGGSSVPALPGGSNGYFANPGDGHGMGPLSQHNVDFAYALTVVPEPAALALLAIGGLSLLRRSRCRPRSSRQS